MSYHPRIETNVYSSFLTTRSRNSELWFINNVQLEEAVLGYAAKFSDRYSIDLYALSIEGNHIHAIAHFPLQNRSDFMRDFNSCVARAVSRYTPEYPGGRFWARRYSQEFVPGPEDIEEYFFYTVLQPVNDGLIDDIRKYPGYNCFHDAVYGLERQFPVVNWSAYNNAKRFNENVCIEDYVQIVALKYARLPGYEHCSQADYAAAMYKKLEERQSEIKRKRGNKNFLGARKLSTTKRGSLPHTSKRSHSNSHRPRVLSISNERRALTKAWYFSIYYEYKISSRKFRGGDLNAKFPPGTFYPPKWPGVARGEVLRDFQ